MREWEALKSLQTISNLPTLCFNSASLGAEPWVLVCFPSVVTCIQTQKEKKFIWGDCVVPCPKTNSPLHLGKVCIFSLPPLSTQKEDSGQCSGKRTARLDTNVLPLHQCCALARGTKKLLPSEALLCYKPVASG